MSIIKNKKGLSLTQMLGTIIIIAIIVAVSAVTINKNINKSSLIGKQATAGILYEYVSDYIIINKKAPVVDTNVDYKIEPALIDMSKIAPDEEEKFEGNFYIYGHHNKVYYDYPSEYILKVYNNDTNYIKNDTSEIDVQKLYENGKLKYKPTTKYILINENQLEQSFD